MSRVILFVAWPRCFTALHGLAPASAQSYPQRAVRFILPFGPGGRSRLSPARMLAETSLPRRWGKSRFVVENRPGGDGNRRDQRLHQPPTTTHTLLFVPRPSTFNRPSLYARQAAL